MSFTQEQIDGWMIDETDAETSLAIEAAIEKLPGGGRVEDLIGEAVEIPSATDNTPVGSVVDDSIEPDQDIDERQAKWLAAQEEEKQRVAKEFADKQAKLQEDLDKERKAKDELFKDAERRKAIEQNYSGIDPEYADDSTKLLLERQKELEFKYQQLLDKQITEIRDPRLDAYQKDKDALEAARQKDERDKTIIGSLKELSDEIPDLKMNGDISKSYHEYLDFVEKVGEKFDINTDGKLDVGKLTRIESAYVDGIDGGAIRKVIDDSGIKSPDELSKFLKLTDFYNKSRGVDIDRTTGKKKSYTLSPKDIYWIENRDRILADERKKEQLKIQGKLQRRENVAVTMTPGETFSGNDEVASEVDWYNVVGGNPEQIAAWKSSKDPRYDKVMDIERRIGNNEFNI